MTISTPVPRWPPGGETCVILGCVAQAPPAQIENSQHRRHWQPKPLRIPFDSEHRFRPATVSHSSLIARKPAYTKSSCRALPLSTIRTGRLPGARRRFSPSIPKQWYSVAAKSCSVSGSSLRFGGRRIGTAVHISTFNSAAGQHNAEHLGPVVAASVFVHFRRAAELAGEHHQRGIQEAAHVPNRESTWRMPDRAPATAR